MTGSGDAGPGAVDPVLTAQQEVERFAKYRYDIDTDKPKAWRTISDLMRRPLHVVAAYFVPCSPPQVIDPIRRTWSSQKLPSQQLQLLDLLERLVRRLSEGQEHVKKAESDCDRLAAELAAARAEVAKARNDALEEAARIADEATAYAITSAETIKDVGPRYWQTRQWTADGIARAIRAARTTGAPHA